MKRRHVARTAALLTGIAMLASARFVSAAEKLADDKHAAHFEQCAKACADCMRACESCAHHCVHLAVDGKKEHLKTAGSCVDCAEFCAAAAKIVSRQGPLATTICESCAKACDICAAECEKFPNDAHMKDCAKSCRDCAKACREMITHVSLEK
jgi:hypothetical protein